MEGGGTRLERKIDVGFLGQRKGEVASRKEKKEKEKKSDLFLGAVAERRGIPRNRRRGTEGRGEFSLERTSGKKIFQGLVTGEEG